ncbi:MAG: 23S rRNA (uracil(1939)-C(5))-methyltransferase RlmD [Cocleimonas sp.]|nr:23S rRNA (uracil(1939)-C(5))-methyltransferase RlmD [Cocleimonas sp.]
MARRRRKQKLPQTPVEVTIESLSQDGKGVTHIDEKTVFIEGALPNEKVTFTYTSKRRSYDEGTVYEVLEASDERVEPKCEYFSICGGCNLQHLHPDSQIKHKQQSLLDALKHIGHVEAKEIFEPIIGDQWGYRRKARLGVRHVRKKGRVLVGFREKRGGFLADIERCEVLHPSVGAHLKAFQDLIFEMDAKEQLPQIEVAVGDHATALIVRHLEPLSASDQEKLVSLAKTYAYQLYFQPKGPDTIHLVYPETAELFYAHPSFNTKVFFNPQDFFQVNTSINRQMVPRAIELLQLTGTEHVLDLFCGLGNFTLPLAHNAAHVTGVEGDDTMVARARKTALENGIANTEYYSCNLMGDMKGEPWLKQHYDCILLDPPRSGAKEVIALFGQLKAKRIVYVSCHPATLARDADTLVNSLGYTLLGAGIMDMFPHTAHVESIAVFEKK